MHFSMHVNRIYEKNKKTDNKRKEQDKQITREKNKKTDNKRKEQGKQTTREKNKINRQQEKRRR